MTSTTFKNKNGTHLKMMNNTQRTMALQKTTKLVKAMGHEEQQEIHKIEAIMQKMERDSKFLKESPSPDLPEFDVNGTVLIVGSSHQKRTCLFPT